MCRCLSSSFFLITLILGSIRLQAQECPENIGFEKGDFSLWQCGTSLLSRSDGTYQMNLGAPVPTRHSMIKNTNDPYLDQYGNFPINCPNGSGFSVQLGNNRNGAEVEMISYTFTVPPNQQDYSIIYNYAVVFQNPNHQEWQQPKFTARVYDELNGNYIECSSFSFTANFNLPGFKESEVQDSVFYKEWTPVTIKLTGYAGRSLRLEFTTYDCTLGGHFGYAYIDVNQNCRSPISGNIFCPANDRLTLKGPYGYSGYRWYTQDFSRLLSEENKLVVGPNLTPGTRFAVEITPFPGQGCIDTLYTTLVHSPEPINLKVRDSVEACINTGVDITSPYMTAGSGTNLSFAFFTDQELNVPVPYPKSITKSALYYIQAENKAGCILAEPVYVHIEPLPIFTLTDPEGVYKPATIDLAQTITVPGTNKYNFTYWADKLCTQTVPLPHSIMKSATYYIRGESRRISECSVVLPVKILIKDPAIMPPNVFSPNGDGVHDNWRIPQLAMYPEAIVQVFTRTGIPIYSSAPGYPTPWDGTYSGRQLPVATYYYVIRLNSELPVLSGSITVVR
jgi:gliding motility-associated-like protein